MVQKKKYTLAPKEEIEENAGDTSKAVPLQAEEDRTEVTTEYHGAKLNVKIGRGGGALLWAVAWAIAIISTLVGLGMLANLLEKIGVI